MLTYGILPEFRGGVHFMKPPYAIGSVPSLSGHAIAYRWRSLPRVRRHRASKPQGSSERVLPWQITMDQLIFASLSHTHYWYEVGMLNVPAVHKICRQNLWKIKLCDWPNKLDTTSWQVLHTKESVGWTDYNYLFLVGAIACRVA